MDRDRPSYFYENVAGSRAEVIEGRLPMALPVPMDAIRQRSADLPAMYAFLADEGYRIDVGRLRAAYPEVAWTSFADWAHEVDWTSSR